MCNTVGQNDHSDSYTGIEGASRKRVANGSCIGTSPVFLFTSNDLQYDADRNGITTSTELQSAGLDPTDATLYSNVEFAFQVRAGKQLTEFFGQAQLRNRR